MRDGLDLHRPSVASPSDVASTPTQRKRRLDTDLPLVEEK